MPGALGGLIVLNLGLAARSVRRTLLLGGVATALLVTAPGARAFEYTVGDWQVNLDTTLSSSVGFRTSSVNDRFVGYSNGGLDPVANADIGDLNFKPGNVVEATQRITTELQAKKDDFGIFVRATGFYDPVYDDDVNSRPFPLARSTVRDIGADLRLLDAYVFARPEIFGHPVDVRVGNQALNWGESTFIQFGINSITPLDVTALRTPGAELRTAFLPIPAVDLKTELSPSLTIEGFWQPYWTRTRIEPVGSFFGTNNYIADGGYPSNLYPYYPTGTACVQAVSAGQNNPFGGCLPIGNARYPTGLGEGGVALRYNSAALNDTEFGLYFENYNSRTPFASLKTGAGVINAQFAPLGLPTFPVPIFPFLGAGPHSYVLATKDYNDTTSLFADYPKNIQLVGFSWNFTAPGGVAIQGEISHRFNQPVQLAGADEALAVTAAAVCASDKSPLLTPKQAGQLQAVCAGAKADPVIQALGGPPAFNTAFDGWKRYDVTQFQTTATKLFAAEPELGINSIALVGEIGIDYMHNFGHVAGLYNAPYSTDTNSAVSPFATVNTGVPIPGIPGTGVESTKGLATQASAAYTILTIIDMPNVLPYGIGMKPQFSLQHDFYGTSPLGVNVFVANTAAASAGVTFSYLQAWSMNVQYTNHFPVFAGGKFYGQIDRDFVSATLSYEF
jgi:hypothetical protein